ncbi:WXG100 family type VII secretion target [Enterococcus sp. BWB1-3]|uniref:WXG100 family type VII secretion target n=1 Tax=unclassified Enterococcus TaxID=2608891 RepID=UPI0019223410|nr:WXG100 family type VII secretion target [Enterococcus sp. CWB-B31]MBL1230565.1 WXG100 family type VII secretion target [Enterococcus sp. BWB1-3]MCB5954291.1 WXG100 family type VII secretion target [Enterococcus sp. CWB-B31]
MADLTVNYQRLEELSGVYGTKAEEIRGILDHLTSAHRETMNEWRGEAAQQFDGQFIELTPKVQQFSELLDEIDSRLKKTANVYEETDRQLKGMHGFQ